MKERGERGIAEILAAIAVQAMVLATVMIEIIGCEKSSDILRTGTDNHGGPIQGDSLETKAESWISLAGVAVGDTADVFVYDDDQLKRLDTYQREVLSSDRMKVASTSGPKIVAMVINGRTGRYSWTASNTYAYMERLDAEFEKEDIAHPTLSGTATINGKSGKPCNMDLHPIMSKIVLRSIRCDFSGMAYDGARFTGAKVYLTNVSTICRMMQDKDFRTRGILNSGMLVMEDLQKISDPAMLYQDLPISIGKDWIEVNKTLYCYPNTNEEESPGSPFTRMVIEGQINGHTWYYPININRKDICWVEGTPGISRDRVYQYDVTIKRTGTDDPDKPVSLDDISVICEVVPWDEKAERYERF